MRCLIAGWVMALALWPGAASACSCASYEGALQARLDAASLVMAVRVLSTRVVDEDAPRSDVEARFKLVEVLKGDASQVRTLTAPLSDCGLPLKSGRFYLVVAHSADAQKPLTICAGSRMLAGQPWRDMQYDAIRRYLRQRKPIHRCDAWSIAPPPMAADFRRDVCGRREAAWLGVWSEYPLPAPGTF